MIDLPWSTIAAAAVIVTLGYTVYGLTGFGATIVALPLLAHFLALRFAVPLLLIFDLFAGFLLGLKGRKQMHRGELLRLLPYLLVGMAAGVTLLARAPERWLLLVLGAYVLGYAIWSLLSKVPPTLISPRWAIPAGLVGGSFTALYGTGGSIYVIYLARRLTDKSVVRASIGVLIFGTAWVRLALFTGSGFYTQPGLLPLAIALLPCAGVGYLAGSQLHARLSTERAGQTVWLLLIAGGASLLWRSWGMA